MICHISNLYVLDIFPFCSFIVFLEHWPETRAHTLQNCKEKNHKKKEMLIVSLISAHLQSYTKQSNKKQSLQYYQWKPSIYIISVYLL